MTAEDLERREVEKYRKVYDRGVYEPWRSVGARVVPLAWEWATDLGAATGTDWGCGFGRATRWLRERGMDVHGVDLVATPHMRDDPRFHRGPLWSPPDSLPSTDFAFSADVLEHVPEPRVQASLRAIRGRTLMGGWLQIATIPDALGKEVGETLHLTVRPPEWWEERVGRYFDVRAREITEREVRLWLTC